MPTKQNVRELFVSLLLGVVIGALIRALVLLS